MCHGTHGSASAECRYQLKHTHNNTNETGTLRRIATSQQNQQRARQFLAVLLLTGKPIDV